MHRLRRAAYVSGILLALTPVLSGATGVLRVRIFDTGRKSIVPARVNVIGSDNAFYEPDPGRNPLSEFSLKRKGNRANVGPLRYYGSFFYTEGTFEVKLPPGPARVEVRRGYGYYTSIGEADVAPGRTTNLDIDMQRVIDMPRYGWHTMDTHLHFDRGEAANDHRIACLLAAEDIEFGHILTVRSARGFGMASHYSESRYAMVSGREATSPGLGHLNLLMIDELIAAIRNNPAPDPELPLTALYDQAVAVRGAVQHDHAGYGQEIYADAVLGKSDIVELLQFGLYRPDIGLEGYYLLLNSGFRYPLAGGSDFPGCRTIGDSRIFVADGPKSSFPSAMGRLVRGESFATSGPLLFLSVDGKGPGMEIEQNGSAPREVVVQVRAVSGNLPFQTLEIVQDGKVAAEWHGPKPVFRRELKAKLRLTASSWIAARCSGPNTVHAHTNPVWVYFDGQAPFKADAAAEVLKRIRAFEASEISSEAKKVAEAARARIDEFLRDGGCERPGGMAAARFPVGGAAAMRFPPALPKPRTPGPAVIEGMVVSSSGRPLPGVSVSARGAEPAVRTDLYGRFVIRGVNAAEPVFLRVSKPGYATTNSSYLNPRSPKENLRILLLTGAELQRCLKVEAANHAVVLLNSAAADGKSIAGLSLTTSPWVQRGGSPPAGKTSFSLLDKDAGLTGLAQFVGITDIQFQASFPPQPNDHEPNVIITANPLAKDIVMPVFTGQVSYATIRE
ncbi:MAG TPA: CehA/McbA family metallohydrolase [Bryobacteraceae bacterium]|nr:CehA/McbA family metallohydrolase [Bryobacteraceae bacterium]